MNLEELVKSAQKSNCYMITATFIEKGKRYHYLITQNYPKIEMVSAHNEIKKLIKKESVYYPPTIDEEKIKDVNRN